MVTQHATGSFPLLEAPTEVLFRGARGDRAAFRELYRRIAPSIYAWANARIRPALRSRVDPEDIVQEVWCRTMEAFEGLDTDTRSFRAWVFTVAKNVLLESIRRHERVPDLQAIDRVSSGSMMVDNLVDEQTTIGTRAARKDALEAFCEKAREMPTVDRRLILHCGFEGLSHGETADRLGISRDAAAKRWQRLRSRLEREPLARNLAPACKG